MSARMMVQAMAIKAGSASRKLVLIKLADNANDEGECWPSINHIADDCEMGRRTVQSNIDKLISAGLLVKKTRYSDGRQQSNVYQLTLDQGFSNNSDGGANPAPRGADPAGGGCKSRTPGGANPAPREPVIGTCHKNQKEKGSADQSDLEAEKPESVSEEMWREWLAHRREIKSPLTPRAARMLRAKLDDHAKNDGDPDAAIRDSIANGWRGVFVQNQKKPSTQPPPRARREL